VHLRYRQGYFATPAREAASGINEALTAALWSPLEASAIALHATVAPGVNGAPGSRRISYTVAIQNLGLEENNGQRRGGINVVFIQQDADGLTVETEQEAFDFDMNGEVYEGFLIKGPQFSRILRPKPGLATLRIAVVSRQNGVVGSLLIPFSQMQ